jgi:hypothetical protein
MRYQINYFVENFFVSTKLLVQANKGRRNRESLQTFWWMVNGFFNKENRQMFFGRTKSIPSWCIQIIVVP